ncbi:hypothetical protein FHX46_005591 [Amycolatopsis viridis]|uniref:Uncharacterized protein n=1 Tax=Amycolatopsis viridis TaxID=185678 RepID=A0ABX0T658_9PSEU|nr:hypothetical protein [Amycolatopsis viridis]
MCLAEHVHAEHAHTRARLEEPRIADRAGQ